MTSPPETVNSQQNGQIRSFEYNNVPNYMIRIKSNDCSRNWIANDLRCQLFLFWTKRNGPNQCNSVLKVTVLFFTQWENSVASSVFIIVFITPGYKTWEHLNNCILLLYLRAILEYLYFIQIYLQKKKIIL